MYWPQGAHRKGKCSSFGALFDPFVTNSRQTCQELNSSTLAGKAAKNAALSTRSFPGAGPTLASRESSPPPARATPPSEGRGRRSTAPTGGPGVHSPLQSAAWKVWGSPWYPPTAPSGDLKEQREGAPDPAGRGAAGLGLGLGLAGEGWRGQARAKRQSRGRPSKFLALNDSSRSPDWGSRVPAASSLPAPLPPRPLPPRRVVFYTRSHPPAPQPRRRPHSTPPSRLRARRPATASREGGAWVAAHSQPRSQPAPRRPTRAKPVTHLRRANSALARPSHTLTPGSRWRRRRRRRRGTLIPGVRRSYGGRAWADAGLKLKQALTRLALFRRRGHVLRGRPGAEGGGRRHRRRGPLGRRGRGRGRQGGCGPGLPAARECTGAVAGEDARHRAGGWTLGPGAPPGPAGCGSRREHRALWCPSLLCSLAMWAGVEQRGLLDFLGEGGGGPYLSPTSRVCAQAWIPPANWRREVTAAAGPGPRANFAVWKRSPEGSGKLGFEPHGFSHMESLATHLPF